MGCGCGYCVSPRNPNQYPHSQDDKRFSIGLLLFDVFISVLQFFGYADALHVDSRTQSDMRKRTKSDRPCCDAHFSRNSIVVHKSRVIQLDVRHGFSFRSNTLCQYSASASFGSSSTHFANFTFINFRVVFALETLGEHILALSI
jgi:hypothetical protein